MFNACGKLEVCLLSFVVGRGLGNYITRTFSA